MVQVFNPSNDVELSIFTTEPAWSNEKIETKRERTDKEGSFVDMWNTFRFLKRDLRLGFLQAKFDDYEWLENRVQLGQNLLSMREGAFEELAPMALIPVVAKLELSQSRNGLLRREQRTFRVQSSEGEEVKNKGFLGRMFG
jgi:hypothetical protein